MRHKTKKEDHWASLSDMMTGLMVIFLFIAISYISQVKSEIEPLKEEVKELKKKVKEAEYKTEKIDKVVYDFVHTKKKLFEALNDEFKEDFKVWNAKLDSNLVIYFSDEDILFDKEDSEIKPYFKEVLDDFFPRYLEILLTPVYRDKIGEIRIEGHTDSDGPYVYNLELSQKRARKVLTHIISSKYYNHLQDKDRELLNFWINANGYSYGRTIDDNRNYTVNSGMQENMDKSRRVEFKAIPKSTEVIEEILAVE